MRCERCGSAHDNARLVADRADKLAKPAAPALIETSQARDSTASPAKAAAVFKRIKLAFLVLLLGSVGVPLYFYGNPRIVLPESPTRERENAVITLLQCLLVFRQIGEQMQAGLEPDISLQCASPSGPNVLRRDDGEIRVSHPNPQLYGYRAIYVTNVNPEPVLLQ